MPQTKKTGDGSKGQIRVVVIDNNDVFLTTLTRYISLQDNLQVVGTATNSADGLRLTQELRPDLAFIDLRMPNVSGLTLISWIREQVPGVCIIAMSLYLGQDFERKALQRGANAFLAKDEITDGLSPLLEKLRGEGAL